MAYFPIFGSLASRSASLQSNVSDATYNPSQSCSQSTVESGLGSQDPLDYQSVVVDVIEEMLKGDDSRRSKLSELVSKMPTTNFGWCKLSTMATTKRGPNEIGSGSSDRQAVARCKWDQSEGYIQISSGGENKCMLLHHAVAWATTGVSPWHGLSLELQDDPKCWNEASHLCHHTRCTVEGHVIWEDGVSNGLRKNCVVWVDCAHCPKKVLVCPHGPHHCLKKIDGVDWVDFYSQGKEAFFCNYTPPV